jgi:hypothetical protein
MSFYIGIDIDIKRENASWTEYAPYVMGQMKMVAIYFIAY